MEDPSRETQSFESTHSSTLFGSDAFTGPSLELPDLKEKRIEFIGKGGFGEVWRVKYLGAEEAWKYIPLEMTSNEQIQRETWIARQINHPNVVRYLDLRQAGNFFVIREDLIRGRDLKKLVEEEGVLSENLTLIIAIQVAEALTVAHKSGVIHQDLKPQNILLRNDDRTVVITDFGMASLVSEEAIMGGTLHFMPPESFTGKVAPSPRRDVWSMGMTLYYLLSGRLPFYFDSSEDGDVIETIKKSKPVPLNNYAPYVSSELCDLISKMLSKDPEGRPEKMEGLLVELEKVNSQIKCPDCGNHFSLSAVVEDACPGEGCTGVGIGKKKEALEMVKDGNTCFADGEYDAAKGFYKRLIKLEDGGRVYYSDLGAKLSDEAEKSAQNLEDQLAVIEDQISEGMLLEAFESCRTAFVSHSRSRTLAIARQGLVREIRGRFEGYEAKVESHLKASEFDEAHTLLLEARGFLQTRGLAHLLVKGEKKDIPARVKDALRNIKAQKASLDGSRIRYDEETGNLRSKVSELDFESARVILVKLQTEFGSASALSEMREPLVQSAENWALVDEGAKERMDRFLTDKSAPEQNTPGRRTIHALKTVIETVNHPCFARLQIPVPEKLTNLHVDMEYALTSLEERFNRFKQLAEECMQNNDLRGAKGYLVPLKAVATKTDLLDREEADDIVQKTDRCGSDIERADELLKSGKELLKKRKYPEALTALETVFSIFPAVDADLKNDIETCRERLGEVNRKTEQLQQIQSKLATTLDSDDAGPMDRKAVQELTQSTTDFFKTLDALMAIAGEETAGDHLAIAGTTMEQVLKHWAGNVAEAQGLARREELLGDFARIVRDIPGPLLDYLGSDAAADVRLAYSTPFFSILKSVFENGGPEGFEKADSEKKIGSLESTADRLEEISRFISILIIRSGAEHPVCALAEVSTRAARSQAEAAKSEEERDKGLNRILAVIHRLTQLIPDRALSGPLDRAAKLIGAELKKQYWSKTWKKILRASLLVLVLAMIAAAFFIGSNFGSKENPRILDELANLKKIDSEHMARLEKMVDGAREKLDSAAGDLQADSDVLLHAAGSWAAWLKCRKDYHDQSAGSASMKQPKQVEIGTIVESFINRELIKAKQDVGSSISIRHVDVFNRKLYSVCARLSLIRGSLGIVFEGLEKQSVCKEGDPEKAINELQKIEDRINGILAAEASLKSWNEYDNGLRLRKTGGLKKEERDLYDSCYWLKAQQKFLLAYGMAEEMAEESEPGTEEMDRVKKELFSSFELLNKINGICYPDVDFDDSNRTRPPCLQMFEGGEGGNDGFLGLLTGK